jgi:hypothetical protein
MKANSHPITFEFSSKRRISFNMNDLLIKLLMKLSFCSLNVGFEA